MQPLADLAARLAPAPIGEHTSVACFTAAGVANALLNISQGSNLQLPDGEAYKLLLTAYSLAMQATRLVHVSLQLVPDNLRSHNPLYGLVLCSDSSSSGCAGPRTPGGCR